MENGRARYRWQKSLVLTPDEGKSLEKIYTQLGCTNVSQFCKAISHGELEVSKCDMPPDNKMQAFSHYRNVYKNLD